jgi:hypothetical protein
MTLFLAIAGALLAWSALVVLVLGLFKINKREDD